MRLMTPAAHVTTTEHALALHPFQVEGGLPGFGMPIGRNIYGGAFRWDPFELYKLGVIGDLNGAIMGKLKGGKTSLVLTILWRARFFGRWGRYLDPKGEGWALCEALDEAEERIGTNRRSSHIKLQPDGTTFINPLDPIIPLADRQILLMSIAGAVLGRALEPIESGAILVAMEALARRSDQTLPSLVDALNHPRVEDAKGLQIEMTEQELLLAGRGPAIKLGELVSGPLKGMFDRETSSSVNLRSDLTVLDLSKTSRATLPVLMLIADAFLQAGAENRGEGYYVIDEAWRVLDNLSVIQGLTAEFKFCRRSGVSHLFALHGMSTLSSLGAKDSHQVALARTLLGDCSTRFIYQTHDDQIDQTRKVTGITETAAAELPYLTPGKCVVQIAGWPVPFLVQHIIAPSEWRFIDPTEWRKRATA